MAEYDISEAFQRIEETLISSMMRNLKRHLEREEMEGINYAMWQAEQLKALEKYRKENSEKFTEYFAGINTQIDDVIREAWKAGNTEQEITILSAIRHGFPAPDNSESGVEGAFFHLNDRKLDALVEAAKSDMTKAERAMLRMANDEYRKVIYNAQVYYSTGAGTLRQAVDMATKDFLGRGITCIEYKNGSRHSIDTYAEMVLRTSQTRAYLQGEGAMRDKWGINTVIVNRRGVACPMCLNYVGRVFYDDVWSSVPLPPVSERKYPLLSEAIAGGLYHPNCKDIHTTFFEGVSSIPEPMTEKQIVEANKTYELEQRQRYNERQIRKYKRLSEGSIDFENSSRYASKLKAWQKEQRDFIKANGDVLKRRYDNESVRGIGPIQNKDIQHTVESIHREAAIIEDMRNVLGTSIIPNDVDIFEKMPYNDEQMKFVKLDYSRRKKLIDNPQLALPNAEMATIASEKFTGYLFNPDNPRGWAKGKAITSRLGYSIDNWQQLKKAIYDNCTCYPVRLIGNNGYGDQYEQLQVLYGFNGMPANVVVSWSVNESDVHMTSAYIKELK